MSSREIYSLANSFASWALRQPDARSAILTELYKSQRPTSRVVSVEGETSRAEDGFIRAVLAWYWVTGNRPIPDPHPRPCHENVVFRHKVAAAHKTIVHLLTDKSVPTFVNASRLSMNTDVGFVSGYGRGRDIGTPELNIPQASSTDEGCILVANRIGKAKMVRSNRKFPVMPVKRISI